MVYRWTVRESAVGNGTVIELLRDELRIGRFMVMNYPSARLDLPEMLFIVYPSKSTEEEVLEQIAIASGLDDDLRAVLQRARPHLLLIENHPFPIDEALYMLSFTEEERARYRQAVAATDGQLYPALIRANLKFLKDLGLPNPPSKN